MTTKRTTFSSDLLLMRAALREAVRPRRLMIAGLLTLLPAAIGLLWRLLTPGTVFDPGEVYDTLAVGLIFSFALTILSVTYGTGIISQEIEQRTIVYLLTRPLPRWRLLLARFLVSTVVVAGVCVLATILLAVAVYGPTHLGAAGIGRDIVALTVGSFAYSSLFLLLGITVSRPVTWGLMFVFGWETWVPSLPGSFARLSVMTYLRTLAAREIAAEPAQNSGNLLSLLSTLPKIHVSSASAWATLLIVIVTALTASLILFSHREYLPREDAE